MKTLMGTDEWAKALSAMRSRRYRAQLKTTGKKSKRLVYVSLNDPVCLSVYMIGFDRPELLIELVLWKKNRDSQNTGFCLVFCG